MPKYQLFKHFKIVGISVRTTNQNGQAAEDIGRLWNRFYKEKIMDNIPDRFNDNIYAIYTDYESDYTAPYTIIIGCATHKNTPTPDGLTDKEILADHFVKFKAKGEMPNAVIQTWQDIWAQETDLDRAYSTDIEVYDPTLQKAEKGEVLIYIAVR